MVFYRRLAKGHGVADQVVIWNAEGLTQFGNQIIEGQLGNAIPDRTDTETLGKKLEVGQGNQAVGFRSGSSFGG